MDHTKTSVTEKKKPGRRKRIVKTSLISFFSLILFITAIIAIAVNFILTPEKITPFLQKMANEQLNAEVKIGHVELTFFSTYPRVELDIRDGLIVSKALKDSCFDKTDTLLRFSGCRVRVNVGAYLSRKRLVIREVSLDSAQVYLFRSKDGGANYDIVAATVSDTVAEMLADTVSEPLFKGIRVGSLRLNHAYVYFDDRANHIYGRVENAALKARLSLSKPVSKLKLDFTNDNILFWQNGQLLVNKLSLGIKTGVDVHSDSCVYHLRGAKIKLNDIGFGAKGDFRFDTLTRELAMEVGFGLRTPSLREVLSMIPESIMKKTEIDAEGKVELGCRITGVYGKGKMPEASLKVRIENGSAHYAGMPYGVDTLTAHLDAFVDMGKRKTSYADLKIFRLKAMDVDVLASCRVDDLLTDPVATFTTRSDVKMKTLMRIFPFQPGVAMGGLVDADLKGTVRLADLKRKDYGKMTIGGRLDMKQVFLNDTAENFYSRADATFRFKGDRYLGADFTVNEIHWKSRNIRAYVDTLRVRAYTVPPKDTAHIARMGADIQFSKIFAKLSDTLFFYNTRTVAKASLKPFPSDPKRAFVNFDFETDTMYARSGQAEAKLRKAQVHLDLTRFRDTAWWPKAKVDLRRAVFILPEFGRPLRFNRLKANLDGGNVTIKRANLRMGRSHLNIQGSFYRLWRVFTKGETLRAEVKIKSRMLDCNQIINAIAKPVDSSMRNLNELTAAQEAQEDALDEMATEEGVQDTLQSISLFAVPEKLDLDLTVDARKVIYDKMVFENIKGDVAIRNRAVNLKKLDMRALEADMNLSLVYATPVPDKADAGFDLDIRGIQIGKLVEFIPALDSTLPMLRSFEGIVDVQTAVSAQLDSAMMISLPTLTSVLRLHGEQLVLMDGETFAEISKLLMFKNKKRNLIDSISAVIAVQDGEVTVYPFIVEIDRYRVGVGGHQDLDMNFDYHISVLKSPVPFKLGINVKGTPDKMKIGLGKALYKNSFTPAETRKVDSARLDLGRQITEQFEGWMNRERRVIRRVAFPTVSTGEDIDTTGR